MYVQKYSSAKRDNPLRDRRVLASLAKVLISTSSGDYPQGARYLSDAFRDALPQLAACHRSRPRRCSFALRLWTGVAKRQSATKFPLQTGDKLAVAQRHSRIHCIANITPLGDVVRYALRHHTGRPWHSRGYYRTAGSAPEFGLRPRTARAEVVKHCEIPLSVLLGDNMHTDGSFETWIIPVTQLSPEQERQAECVRLEWGRGPDNEVMANLLYALTLYNRMRFAQIIRRGLTYLEAQQQSDGSWWSTWAPGPYYCTSLCLRLFANAQPESGAIQRALHFLRSRQRTDGGWCMEGDESDPLSTGFSLLGLAFAQGCSGHTGDLDRAERALVYLQHSQEADKAWPSCPLIRMDVGRATGDLRLILSHGSRTSTTAIVLKAALAWHRIAAGMSLYK